MSDATSRILSLPGPANPRFFHGTRNEILKACSRALPRAAFSRRGGSRGTEQLNANAAISMVYEFLVAHGHFCPRGLAQND